MRGTRHAAARSWWEGELAGCTFADARLGRRLRELIERMDGAIGGSLPLVCQDWANTKAAYRFFANDRVSEAQILAGHFQATRERSVASEGAILVVQDTTEFTFRRERAEAVGITYRVNSGRDKAGRFRMPTVCGLRSCAGTRGAGTRGAGTRGAGTRGAGRSRCSTRS